MNYFNPFQQPNLQQQLFGSTPTRQQPNISEEQFFNLTSTLDKKALQQMVAKARAKGISDADIKAGLDILLNH